MEIEDRNESENDIEKISKEDRIRTVSTTSMNRIIKTILKELYLGNTIITSPAHKIFKNQYIFPGLEIDKQYVVIGFEYYFVRKFLLVESTFYENIMNNGKNSSNQETQRLYDLYERIKKEREDVTDEEIGDETIKHVYCDIFFESFDEITINSEKEEKKIKIPRDCQKRTMKEIREIEEKEREMNIRRCRICLDITGEGEEYKEQKESNGETYIYHIPCFLCVCCKCCSSKEDLHFEEMQHGFYCGPCLERLSKTKRYQRMKAMEKKMNQHNYNFVSDDED